MFPTSCRPFPAAPRRIVAASVVSWFAALAAAQDIPQVRDRAEFEGWIRDQLAVVAKSVEGAPWVAVFPPLTGGVDRTKIGSSVAGEMVVDMVRSSLPREWLCRVLSGAELVAALAPFRWGGGDYRTTADAEFLGAAAGADVSIAGRLERSANGMRLELVAYQNGVDPDPNGKVPTLFKSAVEFVQSRSAGDREFTKAITNFDSEPLIPFGANSGATGGSVLSSQDCELLFPAMQKQLIDALVAKLAAKGIALGGKQLGIFPVLRGADVPVRQFSLRVDQALQEAFENAMPVMELHQVLLASSRSVLWYASDPIEPEILSKLAKERDLRGFLRGTYNYVANSGRVVVTFEYFDENCKLVLRVRRALVDARMAPWMNQALERELGTDEAAGYTFAPPSIDLDTVSAALGRAAQVAVRSALSKLGKKDGEPRPFFLRPTLVPGNEGEEAMLAKVYQQLDAVAGRLLEQGTKKSLDADAALSTLPCTIAGKEFPSYRAAYQELVEHVGLAFECTGGQLLRNQLSKHLHDLLLESELGEQIDLVLPPGLAEGAFEVDARTVILQPEIKLDGGKVVCLVRVIDADKPTRSLTQKSETLPARFGPLLVPKLTERMQDRTTPKLDGYLGQVLGG